MTHLRAIEQALLEDVLAMQDGYVLDFSDRTFASFFASEVRIDINDPRYATHGGSKAKRMRRFMDIADKATLIRALENLWEYREVMLLNAGKADTVPKAEARFMAMLHRLKGTQPPSSATGAAPQSPQPVSSAQRDQLVRDLLALSALAPQPRGYAFEKFLKTLFDAHGLEARDAFRLTGEQIDGSFQLGHETYLLEAKWQGLPTGAGDLLAFNGKVENKAAWSRGLFISNSSFTPEGLTAFGRGKRIICMDGFDLHEILTRGLSLADVLAKKARRAAETGNPFVSVRELCP